MCKIINNRVEKFIEKLKKEEEIKGYIILNNNCKSSKVISTDGEKIYVYNEIDDSEEEISFKDFHKTFLGEAISRNAFVIEENIL